MQFFSQTTSKMWQEKKHFSSFRDCKFYYLSLKHYLHFFLHKGFILKWRHANLDYFWHPLPPPIITLFITTAIVLSSQNPRHPLKPWRHLWTTPNHNKRVDAFCQPNEKKMQNLTIIRKHIIRCCYDFHRTFISLDVKKLISVISKDLTSMIRKFGRIYDLTIKKSRKSIVVSWN